MELLIAIGAAASVTARVLLRICIPPPCRVPAADAEQRLAPTVRHVPRLPPPRVERIVGSRPRVEFVVSLRERSQLPDAVYIAWMKVPPRVAWELAQQISNHVAQFEEECGRFMPNPLDEEELS